MAAASPPDAAPSMAGAASLLGIPGWLLADGLGTIPPASAGQVRQSFPMVSPAKHAAARRAKPASRAPGQLWLVLGLSVVGLVGGAGWHFLGWPGLRRRPRTSS